MCVCFRGKIVTKKEKVALQYDPVFGVEDKKQLQKRSFKIYKLKTFEQSAHL